MSDVLTLIGDLVADMSPDNRHMLAELVRGAPEPIAIIGMGCRFPGGAESPEAFWRILEEGVDVIKEVPPDRWDVDAAADPTGDDAERMSRRWGGFLDRVDGFDPHFFGISPREAASMDPQQRLLLEVAWEALEAAGQRQEQLAGSRTGVFVGVYNEDYAWLHADTKQDVYSVLGSARSVTAGRLSYLLDLQGPSMAVDTACSSSLVAVHLACQSLRERESHLAIAAGVNLILSPRSSLLTSKLLALSPDGRCRTFDARANGFVRGEGCGVVVLKRLSDALADGDSVLAVVRGSAVNQDGRSTGLTAPNVLSQQALIRQALESAGVTPEEVGYVEAHGTGTPLGDPIEMEALSETYGRSHTPDRPCVIGAVKTNIGHLEAAAGIAGLIKVVLAMRHGVIPPLLHFQHLNPRIALGEGLRLATQRATWTGPRLAAISAFGISGTNAHLLVGEGPLSSAQPEARPEHDGEGTSAPWLLPLSARDPGALAALAARTAEILDRENAPLNDLCFTASLRRTHHPHRLAVVGRTRGEIASTLRGFAAGELRPGAHSGVAPAVREVVFVFPGQGSQWIGMGRQLLAEEPAFREAIERCDEAMRPHTGWSLLGVLQRSEPPLEGIDIIQPALFGMQVALAALWRSYGVQPSAVVGHSMGEVAAAHVAGALSLADAALVICRRSRLLRRVSGRGAMLAVELSMAEAAALINGRDDRVSVAVSNGARATVLSGDPTALQEIATSLERDEVFCRWVKVDVASHSPQVDELRPELLRQLAEIRPRPASVPICSTVTGTFARGEDLDSAYWADNLRDPVLFSTAVDQLARKGSDLFVEVSPHPILLPAIEQELRSKGGDPRVVPSLRRDEDERALLRSGLGALHAAGCAVDLGRLYPASGRVVSLPSYPWQRERCWMEAGPVRRRAAGHPLLGDHVEVATQPGAHLWETALSLELVPYLAEHRVQGGAVLPATAYIEMAMAAARALWGEGGHAIEDLELVQLMSVEGEVHVQVSLAVGGPGAAAFQVLSRADAGTSWTLHARAAVRPSGGEPPRPALAALQERCREPLTAEAHYRAMEQRGITYGPMFRGVASAWRGEREALGRIVIPEAMQSEMGAYRIHPALLDAALQLLGAASVGGPTYLPAGVRSIEVHGRVSGACWAHARLEAVQPGDAGLEGEVLLFDEAGAVVATLSGVRLKRLAAGSMATDEIGQLLHTLTWQEQPRPPSEQGHGRPGTWLVLADAGGVGQRIAALLAEAGDRCLVASAGEAYQRIEAGRYVVVPSEPGTFRQLLSDAFRDGEACRGVVHLFGLDASGEDFVSTGCGSALSLVQALAQSSLREPPRLWLVSRGVHAVELPASALNVWQASLWGMGRVLCHEHPELRCASVDIGAGSDELAPLVDELRADGREDQIVLRGASRRVARLVRGAALSCASPAAEPPTPAPVAPGRAFRVETPAPGVLDRLVLRETPRSPPGPGEVEIEVAATGLNFIDVLRAMGAYPGQEPGATTFGGECSGVIAALGPEVTDLRVGDEVVAVATGSMGAFVTTPAWRVVRKPGCLSLEEAAAVPLVFMTVHYALNHLARLQRGERVLIHSASGGTGLAALAIAQRAGAEVFATAGTEEKRELLRSLGVQHVMDSRTLAFAGEILERTGGRGVDVVLNSLSGDAIAKSLSVMAPYGRYLELSKRDIYENASLGMLPFRKSLAYFAIDLAGMATDRPELFQTLFVEVMAELAEGRLRPLPVRVFPFSDAASAFRTMAQAQHVGKIVLARRDEPLSIVPSEPARAALRGDATYLVVGGLGGLGVAVSRWMVERGARHLLLVGRSAPSAAAEKAIGEMRAAGAEVRVSQADVAEPQHVTRLLSEVDAVMPPLAGIFHAAAVLDDGIVLKLDAARLRAVMAPKALGAWNLHALTLGRKLDLFVLFSSVASLLGSPGQANYAAGNAFLDALAHHRQAAGLPALSINWGPWAEVGQAAAQANRGERLALRGMRSMLPDEALAALERLLAQGAAQAAVVSLDLRQWREFYVMTAQSPLLSALAAEQGSSASRASRDARDRIAREPPDQRRALLESHVREQVGLVLRLEPSRIDATRRLGTLGLDSLLGLEIRNRLEASLGLTLPATVVWSYPTVATLAAHLARKMGLSLEDEEASSAAPGEPRTSEPQDTGELDQLSRDELAALLAEELGAPGEDRI